MVDLTWKTLEEERTNLVTDAMATLSMPPGKYQHGDHTVDVDGNSARLVDGRLAGSFLNQDQVLRDLMTFTGCSLAEALSTVTIVPTRLLHMKTNLGKLAIGYKASPVLLTPEIRVAGAWVNGQQIVTTIL